MHLAQLLRAISADVEAVSEADKQWKEMLDVRNHRALDPGRHAGILRWLHSILSSASPIKIKIADLQTGDAARAAATNSAGTAATERGGGGAGGWCECGGRRCSSGLRDGGAGSGCWGGCVGGERGGKSGEAAAGAAWERAPAI